MEVRGPLHGQAALHPGR